MRRELNVGFLSLERERRGSSVNSNEITKKKFNETIS